MLLATLALTALLAAAPSVNNEPTAKRDLGSDSPGAMRVAGQKNALRPHSPTNDEINAAESGNPESLDYRNRPAVEITEDANAVWDALETGNPDRAQPSNRPHEY
ncbi:MAG TPA: hypothetical protein VEP66_07255 [Myxococcales bacterium]|nr:hypothetical protein [Myxococcales bacterium]